jgi:hypothetical protein
MGLRNSNTTTLLFFARATTLAECVNGTLIVATCANILSAFSADKHLIRVGLNH